MHLKSKQVLPLQSSNLQSTILVANPLTDWTTRKYFLQVKTVNMGLLFPLFISKVSTSQNGRIPFLLNVQLRVSNQNIYDKMVFSCSLVKVFPAGWEE